MAHTDSVPPGHGAIDNASGSACWSRSRPSSPHLEPACDVWLVATGSEERQVTGLPYHAGAAALVKQVKAEERARRPALRALDRRGRPRPALLPALAAAATRPRASRARSWPRLAAPASPSAGRGTPDTGNSDHREFELAGLPGAVLEVWKGVFPCHHLACDRAGLLQKPALNRALRIAEEVVKGGSA